MAPSDGRFANSSFCICWFVGCEKGTSYSLSGLALHCRYIFSCNRFDQAPGPLSILECISVGQVWTASGVPAKEANKLPQMVKVGDATRVELKPVTLTGKVDFF